MKTIVEIHALQNFAPSNLNRDDTGAPKDAFFWRHPPRPYIQSV